MFTFGILSSHLPYVALVAFYLFYLFFPNQLKQNTQDEDQLAENKSVTIDLSDQVQKANQDTDYFFQDSFAEAESKDVVRPVFQLVLTIPVINNDQGPGIPIYSALFCRPPPVS